METTKRLRKINLAEGFSLIEIIVVISIIGILAAMALGGFRFIGKAKESTNETKMSMLDSLVEEYSTKIGEYPTDLRELVEGPQKQQLQKRWGEPIAKEDDLLDAWKNPFVYSVNPRGSKTPYELYSTGSTGDRKLYSPRSKE